jgi:hypothetical protein
MSFRIASAVLVLATLFSLAIPQTAPAITLIGDPFSSTYTGWTDAFPPPTLAGNWRLNLHAPTLMDTNNANPGPPSATVNTGTYLPDVLFQNNFLAPGTYDLTATMRTNDDDIIGLVWNYQDSNNFFRVGIRSQGTAGSFGGTSGVAVQKVVGGVITQLSPAGIAAGAPTPITQAMIDNRTPFNLTVSVNGSSWNVLFNGNSIINGTDADLASDRKVGLLSWAQLSDGDSTPDPLFWGSEFESVSVTQGASTLYSETFNARPIAWRQGIMTNATGTVNTGNIPSSKEHLGNFGRTINNPWIHQPSNGFVNATVNNTDFIGPAVVVNEPGATALTDYEMKIRIGAADNDGLGVLVRVQDDNNFYRINFANEATGAGVTRAPRGMSVQKVVGGVWSELYREASGSEQFIYVANNLKMPAISPLLPSTAGFDMFDLSVTAVGNTLTIQVIDHLGNVINYPVITDSSNPILAGSVGLTTWGTENVFYTNYGGVASAPLVVDAVPEPSTVALVIIATVGMFSMRRRLAKT